MKQAMLIARPIGFAFVIVLCGVSLAHATLIGDFVTVDMELPDMNGIIVTSNDVNVEVVGGAVVLPNGDALLAPFNATIDIQASSISIHFENFFGVTGSFITISDLDWVDAPPGTMPIFSLPHDINNFIPPTAISLVGNSVTFNFAGTQTENGEVIVNFLGHEYVPEPTTAALLGTGLIALGLRRRRKA